MKAAEMRGSVPDRQEQQSARAVYAISVAAELTGIDAQTLRLYERRGLLTPARTDGGTRRYSADDVDRLRRIAELAADGVNIAGIAQILTLEDHNIELKSENARLKSRQPDHQPVRTPIAKEASNR
jgi:MerR family transcriptional regulator, heat shock protein HspR